MLHAGKEAIWWKTIFTKLGFNTGHELALCNDKKQIVRLLIAENPLLSIKLRHVDISQHWLRERVRDGDIKIEWCDTNQMAVDGLTKLPPQKQRKFLEMLGLVDIEVILDKENH